MFEFDFEQAIKNAEKIVEKRKAKQKQREVYILYFSNTPKQPAGKIVGNTIPSLINEFRLQGKDKQFSYAAIVRKRDGKEMRHYVRAFSSKFFTDIVRKPKK